MFSKLLVLSCITDFKLMVNCSRNLTFEDIASSLVNPRVGQDPPGSFLIRIWSEIDGQSESRIEHLLRLYMLDDSSSIKGVSVIPQVINDESPSNV